MTSLARDPKTVRCYLELHIEQGPVLERQNAPVGVVTGICGIERSTIAFRGETGHAGTVPMSGRADALVAAADFITAVHDQSQSVPELRATIGTCSVSPNVANGIPHLVELTLEIRAPDDPTRHAFSERMTQAARTIAKHRGGQVDIRQTYEQPAVPCAPAIIDGLSASMAKLGHSPIQLSSGATHDASAMSDLCDVGMLFVRCRDGVSHRPDEFASAQDMGAAIDTLAEMLASFGNSRAP